ncbi:hypothetical protein, partial [Shewanella algae]|uniref:hypothetical protein n=1 Tax=Shewanella algae TaxID=38313 RepID=UPI001C58B4E7
PRRKHPCFRRSQFRLCLDKGVHLKLRSCIDGDLADDTRIQVLMDLRPTLAGMPEWRHQE